MTGSEQARALADTSVAVPAVLRFHDAHELALAAVEQTRAGLAGHALFETFSVLTRHPLARIVPDQAMKVIDAAFPTWSPLSSTRARTALAAMVGAGLRGGAVYDGLVGAAAAEADLPLLTLDRRASGTYAVVGARVRFLVAGAPGGA